MKQKLYSYITIFFAILAFLYTLIRAFKLSLTHDEALTFLYHLPLTYCEIISFDGLYKPANQLLNTLMVKFFVNLFGNGELINRLPALLGHLIYLASVYKLLELFLKGYRFPVGYALMVFHPMMLDFFSMARGYSLALGFLALSLYLLFKNIEKPRARHFFYISLSLCLSVLSYLIYLNVYAVGLILIIFLIVANKKHLSETLTVVPSAIILLLLAYGPIIDFKGDRIITYGGDNGFWEDSVYSSIELSLYGTDVHFNYFPYAIILILSIIIAGAVSLIKKKFTAIDKYQLLILMFLLLLALLNLIQHIFLSMDFLEGWHAIFYLPLFSILILLLWQRINNASIALLIFFMIFIVVVHFIASLNFNHYFFWKQDASTKEAMHLIGNLTANEDGTSLGISWFFEPSVNYYIIKDNLTHISKVDRNGPDGIFDYYYLEEQDIGIVNKYNLSLIKKFVETKTYLAKPETK